MILILISKNIVTVAQKVYYTYFIYINKNCIYKFQIIKILLERKLSKNDFIKDYNCILSYPNITLIMFYEIILSLILFPIYMKK